MNLGSFDVTMRALSAWLFLVCAMTACASQGGAPEPNAGSGATHGSNTGTKNKHTEKICTSFPRVPHARVVFSKPLATAGRYSIAVEADDKKETCELVYRTAQPSKQHCTGNNECVQEAPKTDFSLSCKLLQTGFSITDTGAIASLDTVGTPAHLSISIQHEGKPAGQGDFRLKYAPDDENCGIIEPVATVMMQ